MQNALAFKMRYLVITLIMLGVAGIYFLSQFTPFEQHIIKKIPINRLATLIITEGDAGATTGNSYRYYLFDASKSDTDFMENLKRDDAPFMITSDENAVIKSDKGSVYLTVKGDIYTFNNQGSFRLRDSLYSIPVYLSASPY
nr:hypothetical protein [uncultured Enterobacter sp.]